MPAKKKTAGADLANVLSMYGAANGAEREVLSTGSIIWDQLLGGGLTRGTIVEIGGPPGVGKSTLVLATLKYLCDLGHKCAYLDFEGGVNKGQLEGIGLMQYFNTQFFLFQKKMRTFKDGETVLDALIKAGDFTVVVIDSDTEIKPSALFEGSVEDVRPGIHAQLVGNFLSKYKKEIMDNDMIMLLVSQVRTKLNFRGVSTVEVSGGNGKKHVCDVRMQMKQSAKVETNLNVMGEVKKTQIGSDVEMWSTKNRLAPPFIKAPIRIIFGKGYHNGASLYVWLQTHCTPDGERYLEVAGNGRSTLHWDGEDLKFSSSEEVNNWISGNVPEILALIERNGGFELIEGEDEEDEASANYSDELEELADSELS